MGIADSGIDYQHPDFRNTDGSTKIVAIWDQSLTPDAEKGWNAPEGFLTGVEFTADEIDKALAGEGSETAQMPVRDISGHGTAVAGIAAGREGVAPESGLVVVKLGTPAADSFPRTTELMRALTYLEYQLWKYLWFS